MSDWAGTGTQIGGVSPEANALIDLDEAKDWLKLTGTDDDDFLQRAINDWSDTIETRLNRKLFSATFEDERHDGSKRAIILKNTPVTEISSLTIDLCELSSLDYTFDSKSGIIRMWDGKPFMGGPGSVLVSYTGGFVVVPGDMKVKVNQIVALEYYLSGHGRKALAKRGESAQGGNVTYERSPQDQERIIEGLVRRYGRR
jgi:hypothetical protein